MIELENVILSEVPQTQKDIHAWYRLTDKQILKYRILMIHPTDHKKLNNKEGRGESLQDHFPYRSLRNNLSSEPRPPQFRWSM